MPKKRILVADDEDNIRLLVSTTLQSSDLEIIEADNGSVAYDKAIAERPDLLVLDWSMPGMTGPQVLAALRQQPQLAAVPVIMLTATGQEKDRQHAQSLDVAEYLVKPFSPLQLLETVQHHLAALDGGG